MPGTEPHHLLILGGTAEARALAEASTALFGARLRVTTSLAGRTQSTQALAGEVRRGGFGGVEGLADYLRAAAIDAVIDATHPYALRISTAAKTACGALDLPILVLTRPAWVKEEGDRWIEVADTAAAAAQLPELGSRAFLTVGQRGLDAFSPLAGTYFLVRLVDPPAAPLPLPACDLILDRGPFTFAGEMLIMQRHAIDVLVTKASGGAATAPKLAAARDLGIPVVMLRRPVAEESPSAVRVEDALAWIERRLTLSKENSA